MTEKTATNVANVVLGAAAVSALYVIVKTPSLRHLVGGLAVTAVSGMLPAWFSREVQHAWAESGTRQRPRHATI